MLRVKVIFFLFVFSLLNAYAMNLYEEFPVPSKKMNGRTYPQNDSLLYTGTSKNRLSIGVAVNAMLGLDGVFHGSYTFRKVLNCLMKRKDKCLRKGFIKYEPASSFSSLVRQRDAIVSRLVADSRARNGVYKDYTEASFEAQRIMDRYFQRLGKETIRRNFIKYKRTIKDNRVYVDNNDGILWPSEVIYLALQSYVAALYGPRTIILHEENPSAVDLGYWNLVNSGHWYSTKKDLGEFVAAGQIEGKAIAGYQVRGKTGMIWRNSKKEFSGVYHKIEYAMYKEIVDGVSFVTVLRSNGRDCIERVKAFDYVYCVNPDYDSLELIKPKKLKDVQDDPEAARSLVARIQQDPNFYPQRLGSRPTLIGVYSLQGQDISSVMRNYRGPRASSDSKEAKWLQSEVDQVELQDIEFISVK